MTLGTCSKIQNLELVAKHGFKYAEIKLSDVAKMTDEELGETINKLKELGLSVKTFNVFCPAEINLSYAADEQVIREYTHRALSNAQKIGGEIIVVGSGKARNIPEEYSFEEGREKFKRVLALIADIAAEYNIKVALEPLNTKETNLINTLADASQLCKEINKPNLGFLADLFHMYRSGEDASDVLKYKGQIFHAHIAKRDETRGAPGINDRPEDLIGFYDALTKIGYDGLICLEASSKNEFTDSLKAFSELADHLKMR